jgi:hypothetical protein
LTTVVTLPSVVMVPTQEPLVSGASCWLAQAVNEKMATQATAARRIFMRRG